MIDQNHDGFIDEHDLKDMFASLGKEVSDQFIENMVNEASGSINFTSLLINSVRTKLMYSSVSDSLW